MRQLKCTPWQKGSEFQSLVIQPTGSGKSICFQFPAACRAIVTLVITPTISLMQDQSIHLQEQGIDAVYLGSAQTDPLAEQRAFSDDCRNGRLIFVRWKKW